MSKSEQAARELEMTELPELAAGPVVRTEDVEDEW